jgi:hypothetical protein
MKTAIAMCLLLFVGTIFAQAQKSENETSFEYTNRVKRELNELENLKAEDYFQKADTYREIIEKYLDHKRRVCSGEFSTVVISGQNSTISNEGVKTSLSRDEKRLCYRELKAIQITFINNMYQARKKYLDYLHETRINELSKAREEAVKSLNASFSKNI